MSIDKDELREFIRDNLVVEVKHGNDGDYYNSRGRRVTVQLKLKGDDEAFSEDYYDYTEGEYTSSY